MVSLRGGSHSITSPLMWIDPSGMRTTNAPPTFSSVSTARPEKYFRLNSAVVSASHTCSGVEPM